MRVALDAMGGDKAPGPIIAGAVQAVAANPGLTVVLVGDQNRIHPEIAPAANRDRLEIFHASQAVGMEESPVEALRAKPDNSISRCWQLLAEKRVDAIVGAGSTGAMVAGGLRSRRFLKHVRRPGIATVMPTAKGYSVILDVGANVSPKPEHLFQYGVMGSIFARHMLQRPDPTIGLINVGEETSKGHDLVRDTHALFNASAWKDNFRGNIEGRDIHRGAVDVIVTDGFTGNVILKLCEGVFEFIMQMVKRDVIGSLKTERELGGAALKDLLTKYHYSSFGGAPLLGIDGICIICHGASDDRAICNALGMAAQYGESKLNETIVAELEANPPADEE
ncbi:MAG TPA: phosphate acyltransferase PlsX [Gemmataceae bacterium]|jgi:glycerol-3-phosphate acyltransferase PlsX|nr:phosphate acyltransferase PlsX [Gemmataceae bacterium]